MDIPILQDIAVIFGLSIVVLFLCEKIKVPPIIGFLITGTIVGPYGLHLISSHHEVEILAEIGVVLLMFTIGLELSFKELTHNKKGVLIGGSIQVFLTIAIVVALQDVLGLSMGTSIFAGCLVALSSTAIVLEIFQSKGQVHSSHGKLSVAILIFQDIIMVVMILLIPILKPGADVDVGKTLLILLLKAALIIALVIVSARYVIPHLLYQIARTKNNELFLLCIAGLCMMIAWGASEAGLSLGLGAFLAGLIISESEYSLRAMGSVLPFRSVFLSFFFVSVGTLFNVVFLFENFLTIVLIVVGVILIKATVLILVSAILKSTLKTTIMVGLSLAQIGEFSFLLSKIGVDQGLMNKLHYQYFLSATIFTMALTPVLMYFAPKLAKSLTSALLKRGWIADPGKNTDKLFNPEDFKMEYHLVIIGFGMHGRLLAKSAKEIAIPYLILEMDAEIVKEEREKGEPILYGDATHEQLLDHASIKNAFLVIIAISDIRTAREIIEHIRKINPKIHIIARTHFVLEVEHLLKLGANSVIAVEFEAALEIQRQMLSHFLIPPDEIEVFMEKIRADGYRKYIKETMSEQFDQSDIDRMFSAAETK